MSYTDKVLDKHISERVDKVLDEVSFAHWNAPGGGHNTIDVSNTEIAVGVVVAAAIAIYKKYKSIIQKRAETVCHELGGEKRVACIEKIKREGYSGTISKISSLKAACKKSKDPKACNEKLDKTIKALQSYAK
jgi:hypothetical protein